MKYLKLLLFFFINHLPASLQQFIVNDLIGKERLKFDLINTLVNINKNRNLKLIVIGANDGINCDTLFQNLIPKNTIGLLVEPSLDYYQKLKVNLKNFNKLIFLNSGLNEEKGKTFLYQINSLGLKNFPEWGSAIGSFDRNHLIKHNVKDEFIEKIEVRCVTFNDLLNQYPLFSKIDYLQIDTEGFDYNIVKMIDWNLFETKFIKVEWVNINKENVPKLISILENQGFRLYREGIDLIGVKNGVKGVYK